MELGVVITVYALIFVAELPDKTMIATLIMGSRYRPVLVWTGASLAFLIHATLAVAVGQLLQLLPHRWIEGITAVLFAAGAAYLLFVPEKEAEEEGEEEADSARRGLKTVGTAFLVIFIGEFGDLTQIQAVNFSAKTHQPFEVFFAATAALVCVTFVAAYGGQLLQRVVPIAKIRVVGGLVFLGLGVYTIVQLATS